MQSYQGYKKYIYKDRCWEKNLTRYR